VHLAPDLTSFVGRADETAALARLLEERRLVSLAGPGGVGKSRLAARVLKEREAVHVLELAPVTDPQRVAPTLAEQLGVPRPEALDEALRTSAMLLVLDNCEHLLDACADLAQRLLGRCPDLRILTTTREPLGLAGETVLRIGPLRVPAEESLDALTTSEAGELFLHRAQAARADFRVNAANASAVARICRRLDGLPLAIELAANRVAALAPADIADRLDHLLASTSRGAPERQQTLEATIAWSYALLEPDERDLFDRLSVFVGGFTLGGAEAVGQPRSQVVECLSRLVAKSLVLAEPQPDGGVRYRLLEPLRAFGRANLEAAGSLESTRDRHADYVLELAERAAPELFTPRLPVWFRQLEAEWDNIRLADDRLYETASSERLLRLHTALAWWWSRPDRQAEAFQRFERALGLPNVTRFPRLRGRVVGAAGTCAMQQSDMAVAAQLVDEALAIGRAEHDAWLECMMLSTGGRVRLYQGDVASAETTLREGLARARQTGQAWAASRILDALADADIAQGNAELAEAHMRESLSIARDGLDPWSVAMGLIGLGDLLRSRDEFEDAAMAYEEARQTLEPVNPQGAASHGLLHNLAYVALERGQLTHAAELFIDSADAYRRVGTDRRGLAECLLGLAGVAVRAGRPELAARLIASVDAALEALGTALTPTNLNAYRAVNEAVCAALDGSRLAAAQLAGRRWSLAEALDQARELASAQAAPPPSASLTQREDEVARLLARGLTNRQIADILVISEKTAKNHVQRVLDKLGMRSRAQLAARADELGLRD
jgi:non-specific serine/threonine protein kinase